MEQRLRLRGGKSAKGGTPCGPQAVPAIAHRTHPLRQPAPARRPMRRRAAGTIVHMRTATLPMVELRHIPHPGGQA